MPKQTDGTRVTTLAELIALDPPSAGTKSADNPLAAVDLIFAHFRDGSETIVYGVERLTEIVERESAARLSKLIVRVADDEFETLCAMVFVLRGHHDVAGATTH
jgi:hypothetical protein